MEDFKRALARVQNDYEFYVDCQKNPAAALARYNLSPDERSALTDPTKLADVLERGIDVNRLRITITISGRHDWVNRAMSMDGAVDDVNVATGVEAIKQAKTDDERSQAVLRLIEQIG